MSDKNISGQGYLYGTGPKATNPFYKLNQPGGDSSLRGGLVDNVSMTNEDGVYTFKQSKYDKEGEKTEETEIGTVEIPQVTPGIVEVKDTVLENNKQGYDSHTFTETENDGTENQVGKFYIAQKQVTNIERTHHSSSGKWDEALRFLVVNQKGTQEGRYDISLLSFITKQAKVTLSYPTKYNTYISVNFRNSQSNNITTVGLTIPKIIQNSIPTNAKLASGISFNYPYIAIATAIPVSQTVVQVTGTLISISEETNDFTSLNLQLGLV